MYYLMVSANDNSRAYSLVNYYQKGLAFLMNMCMNMQWYKAEEKSGSL